MNPPALHVACLCAAWCDLCDAYAPVLASVTAALAGEAPELQVHWIDIEDEAELVGDLDIETFPTLVIAELGDGAPKVRFAGPLPPQPETLRRLLRALLSDPAAAPAAVAPQVQQFVARLRQRAPVRAQRQ